MVGTVVIGGGAAGIARDGGCCMMRATDVLLVEARDRVGAGARSHAMALGVWGGHGRSRLRLAAHSAGRNPWTRIASVPASPSTGPRPIGNAVARPGLSARGATGLRRGLAAVGGRRLCRAGRGPIGPCRLRRGRRSVAAASRRDLRYVNGAPLARVSLHDWAAYEDAATTTIGRARWLWHAGRNHAEGLPVRWSTPVHRIDHRGRCLRLDTPDSTIEADRGDRRGADHRAGQPAPSASARRFRQAGGGRCPAARAGGTRSLPHRRPADLAEPARI